MDKKDLDVSTPFEKAGIGHHILVGGAPEGVSHAYRTAVEAGNIALNASALVGSAFFVLLARRLPNMED